LFKINDWRSLFSDFFSTIWNQMLTNEEKNALTKLLPSGLDESQVPELFTSLFSNEIFHFSNPVDKFWKKLTSMFFSFIFIFIFILFFKKTDGDFHPLVQQKQQQVKLLERQNKLLFLYEYNELMLQNCLISKMRMGMKEESNTVYSDVNMSKLMSLRTLPNKHEIQPQTQQTQQNRVLKYRDSVEPSILLTLQQDNNYINKKVANINRQLETNIMNNMVMVPTNTNIGNKTNTTNINTNTNTNINTTPSQVTNFPSSPELKQSKRM
jgi:hypothetical protein